MSRTVKFSLTMLAGLILAACSSGGSGDNNSNSVKPQSVKPTETKKVENKVAETKAAVVKPTETKKVENKVVEAKESVIKPTVNNNSTGAVFVISDMDKKKSVVHKDLNKADNLNLIIVDGKEIRVAYQDIGIIAGSWATVNQVKSCCGVFNSVKFGVIGSTQPSENDYVFYNGRPTQNIPTTGTASYNGQFIISGNTKQFDDEDYLVGKAKFDVDFGNKQVKGLLTEDTLKPIDIQAKISGNNFVGNASSADFASKANVEGKFFGDKAKELGGIFKDNGYTWGGAFGAAQ